MGWMAPKAGFRGVGVTHVVAWAASRWEGGDHYTWQQRELQGSWHGLVELWNLGGPTGRVGGWGVEPWDCCSFSMGPRRS